MPRRLRGDVELRAVGVQPGVGHREEAGRAALFFEEIKTTKMKGKKK